MSFINVWTFLNERDNSYVLVVISIVRIVLKKCCCNVVYAMHAKLLIAMNNILAIPSKYTF